MLASATDARFVSLWDVATGKRKAVLKKGWPGADVEGVSRPWWHSVAISSH
jgi:hypothetical protein